MLLWKCGFGSGGRRVDGFSAHCGQSRQSYVLVSFGANHSIHPRLSSRLRLLSSLLFRSGLGKMVELGGWQGVGGHVSWMLTVLLAPFSTRKGLGRDWVFE